MTEQEFWDKVLDVMEKKWMEVQSAALVAIVNIKQMGSALNRYRLKRQPYRKWNKRLWQKIRQTVDKYDSEYEYTKIEKEFVESVYEDARQEVATDTELYGKWIKPFLYECPYCHNREWMKIVKFPPKCPNCKGGEK